MALAFNAFFGSRITWNALTIIAWAWLAWDYLSHLRKEWKMIWRPVVVERRTSNIAGLYIFLRYGGLIGQTLNMVSTMVLLSSSFIHPTVCSRWYWFQSILIQCLFGVVQYIVMLRVDALYFGDWRSRILLLVSWLFERAALMYIAIETYRALQTEATCLSARPPMNHVVGLVATVVSVQLLAWGMTFRGIYGGPESPLTKQLIRDGAFVCAGIISMYIIVIPYAIVVDVLLHNIYAFLITILSIMGCGLILNLQCLSGDEDEKASRTGTNTWCLDTIEISIDSNRDY